MTADMGSPTLDDHIGFDVDSHLKEQALEAARRDGRSLSNYMRTLLRRQLEIEERLYGADERQPHTLA